MSDYQHCEIVTRSPTHELTVRVVRVHPDSALPLPTDHATILRMLCDGAYAGKLPPFAGKLDFFDDLAVTEAADKLLETVVLASVQNLPPSSASQPTALYQIRFRKPALVASVKVGAAWGAAAEV